jgi:hypothetical protein
MWSCGDKDTAVRWRPDDRRGTGTQDDIITFRAVSIGYDEIFTSQIEISRKEDHLNGAHVQTKTAVSLICTALSGSQLCMYPGTNMASLNLSPDLTNGDEAEAL